MSQSSQGSACTEEQLQELEEQAKSANTSRSTQYGVQKFKTWTDKRGIEINFDTVDAVELNEILRKFYAEVKGNKQGQLSPSSLTCIRASIHRHMIGAPFYRSINIVKDREFTAANNMFTAKCKLYFKCGKNEKPKHKKAIEAGDMDKLGQYFSAKSPDSVVESVWFYLCYYFGRRGREGWASMTKNTFIVDTDSEGNEFVAMNKSESTKNHQGGHKQSEQGYSNEKMYGPAVAVFRFYLSKLHVENDRLFQTPLRSYKLDENWFKNEPIGKNTLANMMQRISKKAGLSTIYTCHSVRASMITTLHQAGVSAHSIISITKHKNVSSLTHYIADISDKQKRDCSGILTSRLNFGNIPALEKPNTSTLSQGSTPELEMPLYADFNIGFSINEDIMEVEINPEPHENGTPQEIPNNETEAMPNSQIVPYVRPPAPNNIDSIAIDTVPARREVDLVMQPDGVVTIPSMEDIAPGTIFNIPAPRPLAPITDSQTGFNRNLFGNATFHGCTFNIKQ